MLRVVVWSSHPTTATTCMDVRQCPRTWSSPQVPCNPPVPRFGYLEQRAPQWNGPNGREDTAYHWPLGQAFICQFSSPSSLWPPISFSRLVFYFSLPSFRFLRFLRFLVCLLSIPFFLPFGMVTTFSILYLLSSLSPRLYSTCTM